MMITIIGKYWDTHGTVGTRPARPKTRRRRQGERGRPATPCHAVHAASAFQRRVAFIAEAHNGRAQESRHARVRHARLKPSRQRTQARLSTTSPPPCTMAGRKSFSKSTSSRAPSCRKRRGAGTWRRSPPPCSSSRRGSRSRSRRRALKVYGEPARSTLHCTWPGPCGQRLVSAPALRSPAL